MVARRDGVGVGGELVDRCVGLVRRAGGRRVLVGIAGPPGAGKSTLAEGLARAGREALGDDAVAVAPMDGFHLPNAVLDERGLRDRKGAPATFDAGGFVAALQRLREAAPDEAVPWPGFDRITDAPVPGAIPIGPDVRLVLVEGNYLLLDDPPWPEGAALLDARWFVTADRALLTERLVRRAVAAGRSTAAAHRHVHGSDLANVEVVLATTDRADLVVRLAPGDPLLRDLTDPATGRRIELDG